MPGQPLEEKRSARRVSLLNEVSFSAGERITRKRFVDLSADGVFIDTPDPLPAGTDLTLNFDLPNGRHIAVQGIVRYHHAGVGMGIQFTSLSGPDREAVAEFVNRIG